MAGLMQDPVAALEAQLDAHLRAITDAALAAPLGGGPPWDGLLQHYGIAATPPLERQQVVAARAQTRGAVPSEVLLALRGLAAWAASGLVPHAHHPRAAAKAAACAS